ncbi:uncharacterized protein UV8b_06163 [Ustilaginoidea virens]|uniref:peptidylprolyl isomerase n=1 Tax=Ustilaginoidea virens TaxID=1159556 RepID=A0A063CCD4_USTVR|nr:uncharacterized protein UV8b_06163 [Ustilaginoidea virens]QUC21922.1 hypothetical protein UV8b_06163 [Ustilaginoidea virens]GAO16530.1 hypothetical protein UVI_02023870 [Ustilaginoidea virens]
MSSIYNLEPQPTASAVIHTTLGEILVELFAKQTPLACRNFLQHSLDGYYDGTIFHRLVPNFILQGGDPTGTGNGGESIYDGGAFSGDLDPWPMDERRGANAGPTGINFKDEFHSRLKFNRRGLLGMANESRADTNSSQFFFTLDKAEELNGRNTLFGRVAGDTIYNLAKIGESEVDEMERPLFPVKIERVEILVNPFQDMKKRSRVATREADKSKSAVQAKKKKRKGGKQLLSFGDEEGGEEEPVFKKTKFDTRLIAEEDNSEEALPKNNAKRAKRSEVSQTGMSKQPSAEEARKETPKRLDDQSPPTAQQQARADPESELKDLPGESEAPKKTALEKANEEIAALKASMRRTIHSERNVQETREKSALEAFIPETSMRARKRRPGGNNTSASEDQEALNVLRAFQSRLGKAPQEKGASETAREDDQSRHSVAGADGEAELCDLHFIAHCQSCTAWDKQDKEESDDEGWMSHSLSFAADKMGKDLSNRRKAEEELVVIDPREKAYSLQENKRADRDSRAGGSRAWEQARNQARNAKLARSASAGRGAK